jgi:hypothetical protein
MVIIRPSSFWFHHCRASGSGIFARHGEGNGGAFFFARADADLRKSDFDAAGVIVREEARFFETIDESLATAREVVEVEQPAGPALKAEMSARAVACLFFT